MIRAAVFDIGGVLEIVDDDTWLAQWESRWRGVEVRDGAKTADFWDSYCGELDVPLRDFVASLRPALIVAALSNSADGAREEEQRRYNFAEVFDDIVYSHEVGLAKPDPAVYRFVEKRLGVRPQEIVFLDDRPAAVAGALAVGWHAVLHTSTPESIARIREVIARQG